MRAVLTVWCLLAGGLSAQIADVAAIQRVFWEYRAAISARDGERAQRAVTAATIAQYDRLRDLALYAKEGETRALPLFEKLMVLSFRLRLTASELQSMSGATLFKSGVEAGWMGDSVAVNSDVDSVRVDQGEASGVLVSGNRPTAIRIEFRREQGEWRFDLMAVGPVISSTIRNSLQQAGLAEDEYVIEALTKQNGEAPSLEVWAPLLP